MEEEELQELGERTLPQNVEEVPSIRPPSQERTGALDDANDDLMRSSGAQLTPDQLARAAVREQMAHGGAYRGTNTGDNVALAQDDEQQDLNPMLVENGYHPNPQLIRGANGMEMVVYRPMPGTGNAPVVAFRGSQEARDVGTDVDLDQVGDLQYESNRALIDRTMSELSSTYPGERPELTGHSLGGALAQRTAADHLDQAGHITTFQAPGIRADQAERIEAYNREHPDSPITADHFRAEGDVVPYAGQSHAPGDLHTTALEDPNAVTDVVRGHRAYIATPYALQTEEGRAALPHLCDEDGNVLPEVADDFYVEGGLESEVLNESQYDPGRFAAEQGRRFVGANRDLAEMTGLTDAAEVAGNRAVNTMDASLANTNHQVDTAQTVVDIASNIGHAGVDDGQRVVSNIADNANANVNRVQSTVDVANRVAQNSTDAVQNEVNRGARDLVGERAANALLSPTNHAVDTAQQLTQNGVSTANTVVDVGQQLARNTENVANDVVDSGQRAARSAVRRGQNVVNRGQALAGDVQHGVHAAWDWLTE